MAGVDGEDFDAVRALNSASYVEAVGQRVGGTLVGGLGAATPGFAAERNASAHHTETGTEAANPTETTTGQTAPVVESGSDEATRTDETTGEGTTHTEVPGGETAAHSEASAETVLGIDLESNALVIVAVAVSLALAALTWLCNRRSLLLATVAFALAFAAFDIAEVAHQLNESRSGLAVFAAAITLVHLATALVAEQRATTAPSQSPSVGPGSGHGATGFA